MSVDRIAELAGVSKVTVWAALAGRPGVAAATRERVKAIAKHVGYRPNAAAKALATGTAETVGFVRERGYKPGPLYEWCDQILYGLAKALEEKSYHATVFHAEPSAEVTPPSLLRRLVDGMVLAVHWTPVFLDELLRNDVPVVLADPCGEFECDTVRPDDLAGARAAVRHLLALGHRRIAYVGSYHEPQAHVNQLRWTGFSEAMSEAGLPVNPGGQRIGEPKALLERIFEWGMPTALLCFCDDVARLAILELAARGLNVPHDISVIGFDDLRYAQFVIPPLTTVRLPYTQIGATAGRMILERIETPTLAPRRVVLPEELIVRASTAPPPAVGT